jgi:hypothetical protein
MEALLERIIGRYGTPMIWTCAAGERTIRGFLQPAISRSWQKLDREIAPLGEINMGVYVYIGSMANTIAEGDWLTLGNRKYQIRRTEIICDSHGGAYRWGLCAQKEG